MRFSYKLLKQLTPQIKSKADLIEKLNIHSFEAADMGNDVIDIALPPNRYSDAASHWGIAREISAILGTKFQIPPPKIFKENLRRRTNPKSKIQKLKITVEIKDKNLCPRYAAQYFENIKVAPSPKWMQNILKSCGLRPINNVVDIMNYVMLEIGEPMHAFDYDKIAQTETDYTTIIVRRAKKGEKITTLDNQKFDLDENVLVISDSDGSHKSVSGKRESAVLALAGIKGGKRAEVDNNTKRIIVEAANFDATNIYKTSKSLNLITDASARFSRGLSPELVGIGINRATELLKEIAGAKTGFLIDVYPSKQPKRIIKFDIERFKKFIGAEIDAQTIRDYLERLGFEIALISRGEKKINQHALRNSFIDRRESAFLVEVPAVRMDIETFEDLAEEVIRLYGYNKLKATPPRIHLRPSGCEDRIVLKDKIKKVLVGFGLSEVYNYSFISEKDLELNKNWKEKIIEIENYISAEFRYLRPSLFPGLVKNIRSNSRFFDEVGIFEIGKVFAQANADPSSQIFRENLGAFARERLMLGIALGSKNKDRFFELKGLISEFFKRVGLVDYLISEPGKKDWAEFFAKSHIKENEVLKIESGARIFGYLGNLTEPVDKMNVSLAEIDLDTLLTLVVEEHEYRPLPKYPSVMRDISILVEQTMKVGEIMQAIQEANLKYIEDVDLIDEYDLEGRRSLTFRIVFQAEDRTLTDKEVNKEMDKIAAILRREFRAELR